MAGSLEIVTLDGPAGAGKSTVARRLARVLGFRHLDTGALYRAVSLACLRAGADVTVERSVIETARRVHIELADDGRVFLDAEDVSGVIRAPEVNRVVSIVAAHAEVRRLLVPIQRAFAARPGGVVAEGRDMATVVFPEARYKFYLDATPEERTRRRFEEMRSRGDTQITLEAVRATLEARDHRDTTRQTAPLRRAEGASRIDTTELSIDAVISTLMERVGEGGR